MTIDTGINPLGSPVIDSRTGQNYPLEAGAGSNAAVMNGILSPSWHVYWDAEEEVYKINNPIVVLPGGNQLVATVPKLEDGDWACKIMKTGDTYTAEVINGSTPSPTADDSGESGTKIIAQIPICTISGVDVIQKHIGTIICVGEKTDPTPATPIDKTISVNGNKLKFGEEGDKRDVLVAANANINIPVPEEKEHVDSISGRESVEMMDNPTLNNQESLKGDVVIAPRANSGLVVQSFKKEENGNTTNIVGIDLVGHHDDEDTDNRQLGLKTLTLDKGTPESGGVPTTVRVFADQDIDLSEMRSKPDKSLAINGKEIAKISADRNVEIKFGGEFEFEVITGMRFSVDKTGRQLKAILSKAKIKVVSAENVDDQEVKIADLASGSVVTGVSYDTTTHRLSQAKANTLAIHFASSGTETITTATEHSKE